MLTEKDISVLIDFLNSNEVVKFQFDENYQSIYSLEKMNDDLNYQNLVYPYVRLNNYKNTTSRLDIVEKTNNKHLNNLETKLSLKSILYRLAKGDTLIMDKVDLFNQNVRSFCYDLSYGLNAKVTANLYYTYRNNKGINLHFDQHDVLVIQIHGQKKWHIIKNFKEDNVEKINYSTKPNLDSDGVIIETILLEEGDFLIVPKGFWHYTQTTEDQSSLHIAFGLTPPNIHNFLNEYINQKMGSYMQKNIYNLDENKYKSVIEELIIELNKLFGEKNTSVNYSNFIKMYRNQYSKIELI